MQKSVERFAPPITVIAMVALYAYGVVSAACIPSELESIILPLDFMVGLPAVFYLLVARVKGMTLLSVIPVIWFGYALSALALGSPQAGILPYLLVVLLPVELFIAAHELRHIARAFKSARAKSDDPANWLHSTVRVVVRKDPAASLAATELMVWYYLLFSWRKKPLSHAGEQAFTTYKESGYMNVMLGLALAFPIEIIGVHILVMQWSMVAATVITLLSLYMLAWLAGDARARIMRPVIVGKDAVRVECGIQCSATIPLSTIVSVSREADEETRKGTSTINMGTLYNADAWITADAPFTVRTPFGEKSCRTIGFSIDNPTAFIAEVKKAQGR